jgi:hypothetical protein
MDEARRVIERLDRIETLRETGAPAGELLAEVRALLGDGEAWLASEPGSNERAREALDRCGERLGRRAEAAA